MGGTNRKEWSRRVTQWRRSRLTATEFADTIGVNRHTLAYWAWRLKKEATAGGTANGGKREAARNPRFANDSPGIALIELRGTTPQERIELELNGGRRLRIPNDFESDALQRLLAVVEGLR